MPDHPTRTIPVEAEQAATAPFGAGDTRTPAGESPPSTERYIFGAEIARGGMGIVFRATDTAFGREVAIKILQARYDETSAAARRFANEARITGQLQHPAIPPVHDLGTLPDGAPFLAMKLVKGATLETLLKSRPDPSHDRGRFIAAFEQICQALAYAHAHRVIHRDLKPSNVMVGNFGEVQVMDWGLAKELGGNSTEDATRGDETLSAELRIGRDHGDVTQAGSLLGTPAFMPPEQAVGAIDQITERSDVFGLGAILCVILTGHPPFVSGTAESTRLLAARGKLDDAFTRLDECGAEKELVDLAKWCLCPDAANRPAHAGEVARAVADLRADAERRARQGELDRVSAEVQAIESRKRRRVKRALAAVVATLVFGVAFASWWVDDDRQGQSRIRQAEEFKQEVDLMNRRIATRNGVDLALLEAQIIRQEGLQQADDPQRWGLTLIGARSAIKRAEGLLESGESTDELRASVATAQADLDREDRDRTLLAELDRIADNNEIRLLFPFAFSGVVSRQYATTFLACGIDLAEVPTEEAVAWLRGHRFRDRIAIALRSWIHSLTLEEGAKFEVQPPSDVPNPTEPPPGSPRKMTRRGKLTAILAAAVDDPFTREWWDAAENHNVPALEKLIRRPEFLRLSSREFASFADDLPMHGDRMLKRELLALAYERFPGDFWVHMQLATLHQMAVGSQSGSESGLQSETIRHLTAAVAARPRSAIARTILAMQLMASKTTSPFAAIVKTACGVPGSQLIELELNRAGLKLLKSAVEVDPSSPWPHVFLGMQALLHGGWATATAEYEIAVRIDPDTAFFMIGATREMIQEYRKSKNLSTTETQAQYARFVKRVAAVNPEHPAAWNLLGDLYSTQGDYRAALNAFRKAGRLLTNDHSARPMLNARLRELESKVRWEGKVDDVLSGKFRPLSHSEICQIAAYCAQFEKKYLLATGFAVRGLKDDPHFFEYWTEAASFAGWAIQAASGRGIDAEQLTPAERTALRRQALGWLRDSVKDIPKQEISAVGRMLDSMAEMAPVRDKAERDKLSAAEQEEWIQFFREVNLVSPNDSPSKH